MFDPIEIIGYKRLIGYRTVTLLAWICGGSVLLLLAGIVLSQPILAFMGLLGLILCLVMLPYRVYVTGAMSNPFRKRILERRIRGLFTARPKASSITLTTSETPLFSIIIPVYNQVGYTLRCLQSISESQIPEGGIEVIVVDDRSKDETEQAMAQVKGVRYVKNEVNLGFLRSVNGAVKHAKGQFICLLNNDTWVEPDWMIHLVETLKSSEKIGIVGAKLIWPEGRLQEFGCQIFSNGQSRFVGTNAEPTLPEFSGVKDVQYCSGACLALSRDLWDQLQGFDELFAPAYFEDMDLCLRAQGLGYRVVVDGRSVVAHWLHATYTEDPSFVVNRKKFCDRHAEYLKGCEVES